MKEYYLNDLNNFISGWYMEDVSLCDDIIKFHKSSPDVSPGISMLNDKPNIDPKIKDSMDIELEKTPELSLLYHDELQKALDLYIKKYPFCNFYQKFTNRETTNIQHYAPGGGYHAWHTERCNSFKDVRDRHLVFMTYLNTVSDGGETEFFHQQLKIKPEKGLTLIWPADWTFTHRGIPSNTEHKYIVTGWLHYYE